MSLCIIEDRLRDHPSSPQIRKLYEPHLFINASILSIFDKHFGDVALRHLKGSICAVGFEPNPRHVNILQNLESAYKKCNWRAKLYTTTAAAHSYGLATYYTDADEANLEWGGSIVKSRVARKPAGVTK